ncbi:MAG: HPr family phosphocarrier protein [Bifidobacteriaceae bacterium]|jgi:phosphocarrier protein|nr:HPr family phosphocarrier protein [Bifidobacteriaceae bacterium]MCI1978210.1 HPr family phosphocarrier protein [Bifidobacteriaceae bacterium]
MSTATKRITITDPVGIHARPASEFSQAAAASGAKVTLAKGEGTPVDATSILSVMSLGITQGDEVVITVEADNEAETTVEHLASVLTTVK